MSEINSLDDLIRIMEAGAVIQLETGTLRYTQLDADNWAWEFKEGRSMMTGHFTHTLFEMTKYMIDEGYI